MVDKRKVLAFDGVQNYVNLGNKPEFKIQGQLTLEAWVYVQEFQDIYYAGIFSKAHYREEGAYSLYIHQANKGLEFRIDSYTVGSYFNLLVNQWYHVAATYDGEMMRLYVDGTELDVKTKYVPRQGLISYPEADLLLGSYYSDKHRYLHGKMSEARLWKIARSQEEIRKDMQRRLTGTEPGLVGYWPLDEGTGDIIHDKSATGNHGSIVGPISWEEADLSQPKNGSGVLSCDGTEVLLRDRPQFRIQGQMTLETWVYVEKINTSYDGIFCILYYDDGWQGYGLYFSYSGNELTFRIAGCTVSCGIALKQWFHIAAAFDGQVMRLYINGEEKAKGNGPTSIPYSNTPLSGSGPMPLRLADYHDRREFHCFTGKMTEARLWNVVRSPEEIKANMQRRLTGKEAGLVGCWPLNEGVGSKAFDKTANGFHGTIIRYRESTNNWVESDLELSSLEPPEESSANKTPEGNSNQTETTPTPQVEITHIFYKGVVKKTQSDEYVEITNQESKPADISGWQIASGIGRNKFFTFPAGTTLAAGQKIRVYTNEVHPETGGFSCGSKLSLWKDSGDEARLLDAKGNLVSGLAYDSKGNFTKTHATK
ncbi:MAG TPA: LamG-like jellyroll fold domain-containing protein [Leptolyngbyaceae cyanobacterium]